MIKIKKGLILDVLELVLYVVGIIYLVVMFDLPVFVL
jgi:hypothetical protein